MNANPASMADTIGPGAFSTMLNRNTPEQELKNRVALAGGALDSVLHRKPAENSNDEP